MKDLSNENVIHVKKNGIEYLQFRKLLEYKDIINHAYSLGTDKNYRTSKPGEEYEKAKIEYKNLCDAIGSDYTRCVKPNQKHTKNIKIVTQKINEKAPDFEKENYSNTDGLITNKKNIILATTNADCILLLLFDPVKKVIANVHSGWRGTLQQISVEAVRKMQEEYKSNTKDIICCMCPSIRKCHFEVKSDVQELYYNEFKNLEKIDEFITPIPGKESWLIDTIEINKEILKKAGLKDENIIDSGICSVCNSEIIHSYRVEKENYGLNTAIIEMK